MVEQLRERRGASAAKGRHRVRHRTAARRRGAVQFSRNKRSWPCMTGEGPATPFGPAANGAKLARWPFGTVAPAGAKHGPVAPVARSLVSTRTRL